MPNVELKGVPLKEAKQSPEAEKKPNLKNRPRAARPF